MKLAKIGSLLASAVLLSGLTGCWEKKQAPAENQEMAPPAETSAAPAEGAPAAAAAPAPTDAPADAAAAPAAPAAPEQK
jgi:PBP1b-binding outer membrane lipoprotein LpoB